ncbi:MAG TPA: DUF4012 domain-containing protein, partial [Patescibacteria group bacterium]|nr:DUF4012 domain-containing protein [Patescibacteria group bacterium]
VSQAGQDFVALASNLQSLKISAGGLVSASGNTGADLPGNAQLLSRTSDLLNQASLDLQPVNAENLPPSVRPQFLDLKFKLDNARLAVSNLNQIFALGASLLAGDKTVLILFENNNELRADGGFMGTFGALKLHDGQIKKLDVSSIYDLDGQLTDVIRPPQPILNLSDRWYLRDANWFANFPDSARKITEFYEREGGETPDTIMVMTPDLIIDLLKIVGPIPMPKYGLTLTPDNFVEQTQVATTLSSSLPTNTPKQILADLIPILLQKLSSLGPDAFTQIVQSLQNELNGKQVVLYSRDPDVQRQLQAFHWTGELENSDRDYLAVVSSNLGGTKTDLYIDQQLNLTTTVALDGTITDELDITRTNKMPKLDQTNNLSYLRVYVPAGSKLLSNIGFDLKNLTYPPGEQYQTDDDVYAWEKDQVTDVLTGTGIGQEGGKTFFGNWLNLEGGETRTVKLVYQLPVKLSAIDRYSLLLQKQIGSQNSQVSWHLNFSGRSVAWKNFDPSQLQTDSLDYNLTLDRDYFAGLVLQKP